MNSLTDLREMVDVVIGVDTHVHTHSAALLDTATGGVLDEITVEATPEGCAELVEFANNHVKLPARAIEGTGGHGASLSRHLLEISEIVIELDRPKRDARRNGAKSDPLDAIRTARVKRWPGRDWELPAAGANAKHPRSSWPLAARRSTPPPRPSCRSSAWRSRHPKPSVLGPWSEACRDAQHRPRACGCIHRGTPRRPPLWWRCGPWLVVRIRW